jgi:hypothetical protein
MTDDNNDKKLLATARPRSVFYLILTILLAALAILPIPFYTAKELNDTIGVNFFLFIVAIVLFFRYLKYRALLRELKAMEAPRLSTLKNRIIKYVFSDPVNPPKDLDRQIIDILNTNPKADLRQYQDVLRVKILDIQQTQPEEKPPSPAAVSTVPPEPRRRPGFIGSDNLT